MSSAKIIENPEVPGAPLCEVYARNLNSPVNLNPPATGLECFLPPPPLPPSSSSLNKPTDNAQSTTIQQQRAMLTGGDNAMTGGSAVAVATTNDGVSPTLTTYPNAPPAVPPNPYMLHSTMQPQTPGQPPAPTPWWITTDSDTSDLYAHWYEPTYKGAAATAAISSAATSSLTVKNKGKSFYKRKNEFIDPAQDAEKVASAQRELSALMKPLKCDLCNAVMNSLLQAKLHYDGKPHQKKVSMFLNQSVKKQKTEDGQVSSTTNNDWQNYCDICKTWFTSQTDATQHYAGKKHIRAANGGPRARPSKKLQNQDQYNQVDSTGRFGIGIAFQTDAQVVSTIPTISDSTATVPNTAAIPAIYTASQYSLPLRCDLCGVSANRQDQLETHKRGARHLRMLRLNGLPMPDLVAENVFSEPIDYSIYRTPSGQYYCAPCNLSLNSEITFAQHVESKKHRNQCNPKLPNVIVAAKKARFKKK